MDIKISACTITKNEELNIGKSIESYKNYVDEIIIVDTGSIDNTKEIASSLGAKVLDFEWINDFAAAKNYAIDNTTGDWIVFLDADEWFDGDTAKNIKSAIQHTIKQGYDSVACKLVNFSTETEILETASTIRIFRKASNIRFCRAIHEALFDTNKDIALPGLYNESLTINHSGYMKNILTKKAERNKALINKNYALGNAKPIDYFYGMRENLMSDLELSNHFFKLIENDKNYDEAIESYNIGNSIDENKIKLVNMLNNKYSFSYREKLLNDLINKNIGNPIFKSFEYMLFEKIDKKRAINALYSAIETEDDFSKNNLADSNSFYTKKSETYSNVGEYELLINDRVNALEHFTKAIKADYTNEEALKGILAVISDEKPEDMVIFFNSLYDTTNKDVIKFLTNKLRLSKFKELFLYYFVEYYKKFNEIDLAFFTSRLITNKPLELVDTYLDVYNNSKDEKALLLISAALVFGDDKEKFLQVSNNILPLYCKILNAYFDEQKLDKLTEQEFNILLGIFKEISYIADNKILLKLINLCDTAKERFYFEVIKHYYSNYSYLETLAWIDYAKEENMLKNNLKIYANFLMVNIYFRTNNFEKIEEPLKMVIDNGFLDQDVLILCELLQADDENLSEFFELLDLVSYVRKNSKYENLVDENNDIIKFMSIDKLQEFLSSGKITVLEDYLKLFFDFAEFAKDKKAFSISEKYYKICLRYKYKMDKSYFSLGEIYNIFGKADLSFYCYQKAFCENLLLARELLSKEHPNYNYVFSIKEENIIDKCPICGGESKATSTYLTLNDKNLSYNEPVIVKYGSCTECDHVFAINDIKDKTFWNNEKVCYDSKKRISVSYDILETLTDMSDSDIILQLDNDNGEFKIAAKNFGFCVEKDPLSKKFDIIMGGNILNSTYSVEEVLNNCIKNLSEDGIIIFQLFDKENAFSSFADKPLWVKTGVKNIFSKKSIEVLFKKFGLQILQIDVDKINEGEIIIYLVKE